MGRKEKSCCRGWLPGGHYSLRMERRRRKEDEVSPSLLSEGFKNRIADFQTEQRASSVTSWKINCESLSGSLTSAFPLLKDRSNFSYCFTCTDTSYAVLTGFVFILL